VSDIENDLLRALAELGGRIVQALRTGDADAARTEAATQIDRLREMVAGFERARPAVAAVVDLARIGEALGVVAQALRTPGREAEASQALAELQAAAGRAPARDEAAEREHYREKARAAMDDYFRQHPIKPFKP
jgi:hypothetical protein